MKIAYIFIFLLFPFCLKGQPLLSGYFNVGGNAVSEGAFLQSNLKASYEFDRFIVSGGLQFTMSRSNQQSFSGYFFKGAAKIFTDKFPVIVSFLYLRNPYSRLLSENNFCLTAEHRWKHFELMLGNSIRIWRLSRRRLSELGISGHSDLSIAEYRNLMYRGTWHVNPIGSKWNLSFSLTNFDDFLIQRGTNPMLNCGFVQVLKSDIELFSELWYQGAGMFNLQADYFGFYVKTGIRWPL